MTEAVLFDFDGVIADTMPYHVKAWNTVFSKYDVKIDWSEVSAHEGRMAEDIGARLARQKGLSLSEAELDELTRFKRRAYREVTEAKLFPGVEDAIAFLKSQSKKVALVTGSILPNILPVVGEDFLDNFDAVVTGNSVTNTKPHPEPYLTASKKLGVEPAQCLVIENAPMGILSAKRAGMYCVAVQTTIQDNLYLKEADLIVKDILSIPLEQLLNGKQ